MEGGSKEESKKKTTTTTTNYFRKGKGNESALGFMSKGATGEEVGCTGVIHVKKKIFLL